MVQATDWSNFFFTWEFLPDRILIYELNISNENFTLHVHKYFQRYQHNTPIQMHFKPIFASDYFQFDFFPISIGFCSVCSIFIALQQQASFQHSTTTKSTSIIPHRVIKWMYNIGLKLFQRNRSFASVFKKVYFRWQTRQMCVPNTLCFLDAVLCWAYEWKRWTS